MSNENYCRTFGFGRITDFDRVPLIPAMAGG